MHRQPGDMMSFIKESFSIKIQGGLFLPLLQLLAVWKIHFSGGCNHLCISYLSVRCFSVCQPCPIALYGCFPAWCLINTFTDISNIPFQLLLSQTKATKYFTLLPEWRLSSLPAVAVAPLCTYSGFSIFSWHQVTKTVHRISDKATPSGLWMAWIFPFYYRKI